MALNCNSHPFGNEKNVSIKQLFCNFCNHLHLGQWELARACIGQLHKQSANIVADVEVIDILNDVIKSPYGISIGSDTIPSPHHLSWVCLQELQDLCVSYEKDSVEVLRREVEFRILLAECSDKSTSWHLLQDLYKYHRMLKLLSLSKSISEKEDEIILTKLTAPVQEFIRSILCTKTLCGHLLIQHLLNDLKTLKQTNHILSSSCNEHMYEFYDIYIHCLNQILSNVKEASHRKCERRKQDGSVNSDVPNQVSVFIQLLALFSPPADFTSEKVYSLILDMVCIVNESDILPQESVYSAFLGHNNTHILEHYCTAQQKYREQKYKEQFSKYSTDSMDENLSWLIGVCNNTDRGEAWRDLYLQCVEHKRHFLDIIMELCVSLIQHGQLEELHRLLAPEEFHALWPLVLLVGWDHTPDIHAAGKLLSLLQSSQAVDSHPALVAAANSLAYQLNVAQWCLDNIVVVGGSIPSSGVLHSIEMQSAVAILHHCGALSNSSNHQQIQEFLCSKPLRKDMLASHKKNVKFTEPVAVEQETDLSLYRAFHILHIVMEAIMFCAESESWEKLVQRSNSRMRSLSALSANSSLSANMNKFSLSRQNSRHSDLRDEYHRRPQPLVNDVLPPNPAEKFKQDYMQNVIQVLECAKEDLGKLYPLNYRLEVLENVFALVFITHDEMKTGIACWEIGNEGAEDASVSQHKSHSESDIWDTQLECNSNLIQLSNSNCMNEITRTVSGNMSGHSSTSASSVFCHGFLVGEFMVRDLLLMLKDAVIELKTAKFAMTNSASGRKAGSTGTISEDAHAVLMQSTQCSIDATQLPSRIGRLSQYISEALWRFQLTIPNWMPREFGKLPDVEKTFASEEFLGENYKCGLTDSAATVTDVSSSGSGAQHKGHRKHRRRVRSHGQSPNRQLSGVVWRMLASKEALLTECVHHGKISQARQVVKMFCLEEHPLAQEVVFAEHFAAAITKLNQHDILPVSRVAGHPHSKSLRSSLGLRKTSLSAIAKVAASGVASLSVTGVVDEILSVTPLPTFAEVTHAPTVAKNPCSGSLSPGMSLSVLSQFFHPENAPAMVIMDLACVGCKSIATAATLLDMVSNRLPPGAATWGTINASLSATSCSPGSIYGSTGAVVSNRFGYVQLLAMLQKLVQYNGAVEGRNSSPLNVCQLLTQGTRPLVLAELQTIRKFEAQIDVELQQAAAQWCEFEMPAGLIAQQRHGQGIKLMGKPSTLSATVKQLISIQQKLMPDGGALGLLLKRLVPSLGSSYLSVLAEHLQVLSALLASRESRESRESADNSDVECFTLLNHSPTQILGRLIFQQHTSPHSLEGVARKVHLDLSRIIIRSSCAPSPSHICPQLLQNPVVPVVEGKVVLNLYPHSPSDVHAHSSQSAHHIVAKLLAQLLKLLKDEARSLQVSTSLTPTIAGALARSGIHHHILSRTSLLATTDLTTMATTNDKLCFYSNLLNLMYIHMVLYEAEQQESTQTVEPSGGIRQKLLYRQRAYQVGQLGVVSYYDLKHIIMRQCLKPYRTTSGVVAPPMLDPLDPWCLYGCPTDPRLMFVITSGRRDSPFIQVLAPEFVQHQLTAAMQHYLQTTVRVTGTMVSIPMLFWDHGKHFTNSDKISPEILVQFLNDQVTGKLRQQLGDAMRSRDGLHIIPTSTVRTDLYVVLDPALFVKVQRSVHAAERRGSAGADELTPPPHPGATPPLLMYPLTSDLTQYLGQQSEIAAVMASLLCQTDSSAEEIIIQENHFPEVTPTNELDNEVAWRKPGIKSKLLQALRLEENYPILHRHLQFCTLPTTPESSQSASITQTTNRHFLKTYLKTTAILGPTSGVYLKALWMIIDYYLGKKDWHVLVGIMTEVISDQSYSHDPTLVTLRDYVLCCTAQSPDVEDGWRHLVNVTNESVQHRAVLSGLARWSVEVGISLLQNCVRSSRSEHGLHSVIVKRLTQMEVYQKITAQIELCLRKKQGPSSMLPGCPVDQEVNQSDLQSISEWQGLVQQSQDNPQTVLSVLLKTQTHDITRQWASIFKISRTLMQEIEKNHIRFLLESQPSDCVKAFQLLESLLQLELALCLDVCEYLLESLSNKSNSLFIVQFMLSDLHIALSKHRQTQLAQLTVGCRAVLCLPDTYRSDYEHLVSAPLLLLEQLLMNMKVEWAGQVLASIQRDLASSLGDLLVLTQDQCDQLLESYATKALEFPIVEVPDTPSVTKSHSRSSSGTSVSIMSPVARLHRSVSTAGIATTAPMPAPIHRSDSIGHFTKRHSSMHVPTGSMTSARTSIGSPYAAGTPINPALSPRSSRRFLMPAEPPDKENWMPDSAATVCVVCNQETFSMFNRRHHCRRCGRVVCGTCSQHTTLIQGKATRTCKQCYAQLNSVRESNPERIQRADYGSPSPGVHIIVGSGNPSEYSHSPGGSTLQGNRGMTEAMYILDSQEDCNTTIRDEFYYDYSPSTSLCLALLELHSDAARCGQVLVMLADEVSTYLRPLPNGQKNPEVDYSFVTSMLKYLLFKAKVQFLRVWDNAGVGQCDLFTERVHLLSLLVTVGTSYVPSLQQLAKMDTLRLLRDRLIAEEKLDLAMEVSTKCGVDAAGVWAAWGITCLRVGDYTAARQKFAKCLKVPTDKNVPAPSSKLLTDIISCIEESSVTAVKGEHFLTALGSVKQLLMEPGLRGGEWRAEDPAHAECLFYLTQYGSHLQTVTYYRQQRQLALALRYITIRKCSTDVFVDGLLLPCLEDGQLRHLQDQLVNSDPSLNRWATHLTATCRTLNHLKYMNTLYQMQLFMKDYIRAAMTCVTHFYPLRARDYLGLQGHISHLHQARQHLEAYLSNQQWRHMSKITMATREQESPPLRLIMTPAEVTKYMHTVDLQIEVTKHLSQYHNIYEEQQRPARASPSLGRNIPASLPEIPTLFMGTKMKAQLVAKIMLCCHNVHDGFGLAFRIIREYKLDSNQIYVDVACQLAQQNRYSAVSQLVNCIRESGMYSDIIVDQVVTSSVKIIGKDATQDKEVDALIRMIKSDKSKIEAFISCGKLRSAYLVAAQGKRWQDVQHIAETAQCQGQVAVKAICEKWLAKNRPTTH